MQPRGCAAPTNANTAEGSIVRAGRRGCCSGPSQHQRQQAQQPPCQQPLAAAATTHTRAGTKPASRAHSSRRLQPSRTGAAASGRRAAAAAAAAAAAGRRCRAGVAACSAAKPGAAAGAAACPGVRAQHAAGTVRACARSCVKRKSKLPAGCVCFLAGGGGCQWVTLLACDVGGCRQHRRHDPLVLLPAGVKRRVRRVRINSSSSSSSTWRLVPAARACEHPWAQCAVCVPQKETRQGFHSSRPHKHTATIACCCHQTLQRSVWVGCRAGQLLPRGHVGRARAVATDASAIVNQSVQSSVHLAAWCAPPRACLGSTAHQR
jgi:hypothetical protein